MSKEYRVTWEIDVSANSPAEAALAALNAQRREGSIANVFTVTEAFGGMVEVDLQELEELRAERDGFVLGAPDGTETPAPDQWAREFPESAARLAELEAE